MKSSPRSFFSFIFFTRLLKSAFLYEYVFGGCRVFRYPEEWDEIMDDVEQHIMPGVCLYRAVYCSVT